MSNPETEPGEEPTINPEAVSEEPAAGSISDEKVLAFAGGELSEEEAEEVRNILKEDPEGVSRLAWAFDAVRPKKYSWLHRRNARRMLKRYLESGKLEESSETNQG